MDQWTPRADWLLAVSLLLLHKGWEPQEVMPLGRRIYTFRHGTGQHGPAFQAFHRARPGGIRAGVLASVQRRSSSPADASLSGRRHRSALDTAQKKAGPAVLRLRHFCANS